MINPFDIILVVILIMIISLAISLNRIEKILAAMREAQITEYQIDVAATKELV